MGKKYESVDYSFMVGQHYGKLQVLEILPREKTLRGYTKRATCSAICECGTIKAFECYRILKGKCHDCGCDKTPRKKQIMFATDCVWECPYTISKCSRSYNGKICCRECDRQLKCETACLNTPEKCGALKREPEKRKNEK